MPDQKGIMLGIITPFGPVTVVFTVEKFASLVQKLNAILEMSIEETSIPKVFEDAFKKKEE